MCGRLDLEPDVRADAAQEIPDQSLDPAKASRMLGWEPRFTPDEALARTVAWYRRFLEDGRRT